MIKRIRRLRRTVFVSPSFLVDIAARSQSQCPTPSKIPTSGCSGDKAAFHTQSHRKRHPPILHTARHPAITSWDLSCSYSFLSPSLSLSLLARSRILRVPVLETFQRQAGVIEGDRFPSLYSDSSENFLAQTCVWSLAPFLSTLSRSETHPSLRPQRWKPFKSSLTA